MIGKVYNMPPQPPAPENTRYLQAGAITFGIEYRDVDPESLEATYADDAAQLAELEKKSPEGGFSDEGVSIHVCGTDDGHEYVRFDVFDDEPHYHYIHRTPNGAEVVNNVIDFDTTAHGEMLAWAIERLRTRQRRAVISFRSSTPTLLDVWSTRCRELPSRRSRHGEPCPIRDEGQVDQSITTRSGRVG
jgi:hypothetical protein